MYYQQLESEVDLWFKSKHYTMACVHCKHWLICSATRLSHLFEMPTVFIIGVCIYFISCQNCASFCIEWTIVSVLCDMTLFLVKNYMRLDFSTTQPMTYWNELLDKWSFSSDPPSHVTISPVPAAQLKAEKREKKKIQVPNGLCFRLTFLKCQEMRCGFGVFQSRCDGQDGLCPTFSLWLLFVDS